MYQSCCFDMELLTGFEPVTSSLPRTCSTSWAIAAYIFLKSLPLMYFGAKEYLVLVNLDVALSPYFPENFSSVKFVITKVFKPFANLLSITLNKYSRPIVFVTSVPKSSIINNWELIALLYVSKSESLLNCLSTNKLFISKAVV